MSEDRRITDPFKDDLRKLVDNVFEIKQSLSRLEEKMLKVDDHHRTLYGINGTPGLTIVVDRLNELEKDRKGHLMVIYSSIVVVAIKSFWSLVTGGKGN